MIRHIVLIRLRAGLDTAAIDALFAPLPGLAQRLGFTAAWGQSESPEQIERGYKHGFVAEFTDWAALAAYQDDPGHKVFGASLVAQAEGGLDGILVFDLAFPPGATQG
jgi:hypothetical protein